jgi:cyclic beta-1,2-glucan synthetase
MNAFSSSLRAGPDVHPLPPKAEQPIRLDYYQEERLRRLGAELASGRVPDFPGLGEGEFHARIKENAARILAVYTDTNSAQARGEAITPAAQWLLDNNYLVEESIVQVRRDLPKRFYRELPTVKLPGGALVPRTLLIAWAYIAHTDSSVSPDTFRALVEGYQSVEPLKIGEIWALPSFLRFVLAENLRRLAVRVDRARLMRRTANETADRLAKLESPAEQEALLAGYSAHASDASFATQLLYRLRDGSKSAGNALRWLERELERHGSDAEEITRSEHRNLASGNVTTGNIIRGFRTVNDVDWTQWFEAVSRIDVILRERTRFAELDFASRDQYRTEIEDLARRSGLSETAVTERVVARSLGTGGEDGLDVGFFLVGPRRREFEKEIGYRPTVSDRVLRLLKRGGWVSLAVPVALLTVLFMLTAWTLVAAAGLSTGWAALLLVLFLFPAMEGAVALFNTLTLVFMRPTRLIGYEYRDGVPEDARTLVVVPALIG